MSPSLAQMTQPLPTYDTFTAGKKVHEDVFTQFEQVLTSNNNHNNNNVKQRSMLDLFRKRRLRRNMIISFLSWTLIVTLADAHARNVVNIKFSFYESVALFCAMEMPGELTAIWSVNNLGRRWSAASSLFFSGFFTVLCVVFLDISGLATALLALCGRYST